MDPNAANIIAGKTMNITGKQMSWGAVLVGLSMAAAAVGDIKALGIGGFIPATRGHVHQVAENLTVKDKESQQRWIDLYQEKLFETELEQQTYEAEHGKSNEAAALFESRKRGFRKKLKLLGN